jgi:hypothetical protein
MATTDRERGVALVEMALVLPLLFVLVLGIVESSWAFAQKNAVQSVAREGARLAATRADLDTPGITAMVCDGQDIEAQIDLEATGQSGAWTFPGAVGFFEVVSDYDPITGFFPMFDGVELSAYVEFVVETDVEPLWWSTSGGGATC